MLVAGAGGGWGVTLHPIPWTARCCGSRGGLCESVTVISISALEPRSSPWGIFESESLPSYYLAVVAKPAFNLPISLLPWEGSKKCSYVFVCTQEPEAHWATPSIVVTDDRWTNKGLQVLSTTGPFWSISTAFPAALEPGRYCLRGWCCDSAQVKQTVCTMMGNLILVPWAAANTVSPQPILCLLSLMFMEWSNPVVYISSQSSAF